MDTGEIIEQEKITIEDLNLPIEEIEAMVHNVEHICGLYVTTLQQFNQ